MGNPRPNTMAKGETMIRIRMTIKNMIAITVRNLGYRFNKPNWVIWGMTHIAFEIIED